MSLGVMKLTSWRRCQFRKRFCEDTKIVILVKYMYAHVQLYLYEIL